MYDRILVPTDGSETAAAAFERALDLADHFDAEIRVLHVVDAGRYDTSIESQVAPLRRTGTRYVDRLVETAADSAIPVDAEIRVGRPATEIVAAVDDHDVGLVVMGTRGRGGLARRVLGSVTSDVLARADVPVHVVPPADDGDRSTPDGGSSAGGGGSSAGDDE